MPVPLRAAAVAVPLGLGALVAVAVGRHEHRSRHRPAWKSVTVQAAPEAIRREPLDAIEVEVRLLPAPGDRGTEVHARLIGRPTPERDFALRTALRDAKSLTETGGVLHVDPRPHGHRRATPWGELQDEAERHAKGWGLL